MKKMLPDTADRAAIDEIVKEEMGHILTLTGELASPLPPGPQKPS